MSNLEKLKRLIDWVAQWVVVLTVAFVIGAFVITTALSAWDKPAFIFVALPILSFVWLVCRVVF